jgi:UDPglucose 6-dehydrogenase
MLNEKVCVIGLWHLGCVTSACLADLGYSVVGVDRDERRVALLNEGTPPLFEPGLAELILDNLKSKRLSYSTDLKSAIEGAGYIIIAFDTAVDEDNQVDLSNILLEVGEIGRYMADDVVVVITSQVPVGTCDRIESLIKKNNPGLRFSIACSPENLRLGQAIESFRNPDRIVIGADNTETLDRVEQLFTSINSPILRMSLESAEMTKHALNTLLATSISFGNEIANLCDGLGADALDVVKALRMDERIGDRLPLLPGLGFSGTTLERDLKVLQNLGDKLDYETYLVDAVDNVNERQNQLVLRKLEKVFSTLKGRQIGILGLTYKPGTSTLRNSVSLEIIGQLVKKGAMIKAYDPRAAIEELPDDRKFEVCEDAYAVARDSDALVMVTEWPEFRELDFDSIKLLMKEPVFIDAKNMLADRQLADRGFVYIGVGRGK